VEKYFFRIAEITSGNGYFDRRSPLSASRQYVGYFRRGRLNDYGEQEKSARAQAIVFD
jgi:hypothetical protein